MPCSKTPACCSQRSCPLVDFVQVVIARIVLAVPPWVGDRRHLTHILQNLGIARVAIAPIFAAVAVGTGLAAILWLRS